jgi:hypothetical protein
MALSASFTTMRNSSVVLLTPVKHAKSEKTLFTGAVHTGEKGLIVSMTPPINALPVSLTPVNRRNN